jgi:hypothetical protein
MSYSGSCSPVESHRPGTRNHQSGGSRPGWARGRHGSRDGSYSRSESPIARELSHYSRSATPDVNGDRYLRSHDKLSSLPSRKRRRNRASVSSRDRKRRALITAEKFQGMPLHDDEVVMMFEDGLKQVLKEVPLPFPVSLVSDWLYRSTLDWHPSRTSWKSFEALCSHMERRGSFISDGQSGRRRIVDSKYAPKSPPQRQNHGTSSRRRDRDRNRTEGFELGTSCVIQRFQDRSISEQDVESCFEIALSEVLFRQSLPVSADTVSKRMLGDDKGWLKSNSSWTSFEELCVHMERRGLVRTEGSGRNQRILVYNHASRNRQFFLQDEVVIMFRDALRLVLLRKSLPINASLISDQIRGEVPRWSISRTRWNTFADMCAHMESIGDIALSRKNYTLCIVWAKYDLDRNAEAKKPLERCCSPEKASNCESVSFFMEALYSVSSRSHFPVRPDQVLVELYKLHPDWHPSETRWKSFDKLLDHMEEIGQISMNFLAEDGDRVIVSSKCSDFLPNKRASIEIADKSHELETHSSEAHRPVPSSGNSCRVEDDFAENLFVNALKLLAKEHRCGMDKMGMFPVDLISDRMHSLSRQWSVETTSWGHFAHMCTEMETRGHLRLGGTSEESPKVKVVGTRYFVTDGSGQQCETPEKDYESKGPNSTSNDSRSNGRSLKADKRDSRKEYVSRGDGLNDEVTAPFHVVNIVPIAPTDLEPASSGKQHVLENEDAPPLTTHGNGFNSNLSRPSIGEGEPRHGDISNSSSTQYQRVDMLDCDPSPQSDTKSPSRDITATLAGDTELTEKNGRHGSGVDMVTSATSSQHNEVGRKESFETSGNGTICKPVAQINAAVDFSDPPDAVADCGVEADHVADVSLGCQTGIVDSGEGNGSSREENSHGKQQSLEASV